MTLQVLLQPGALAAIWVWNFAVLSAAQLTIRLIRAYSLRTTLVGAVVLSLAALPTAAIYDLAVGPQASLATRLAWLPLAMVLNGLAGYAIARWLLRIRRTRGQIIAGVMMALLDPHLFTLSFA